jgi:hypothetical protein
VQQMFLFFLGGGRLTAFVVFMLGFARFTIGLPDGTFPYQTSQIGLILEGITMEDAGIFYGHLVHFPTV